MKWLLCVWMKEKKKEFVWRIMTVCNCRTVRWSRQPINSSLVGVYKKTFGASVVYGMLNGVQGLLSERYVDFSNHIQSDLDIEC